MAVDKDRSRRFGEPAKFLPVIFVVALIAAVYGIYTYAHLFRLLQVDKAENLRDLDMFKLGVIETVLFNVLVFMVLVCFILSVITPPGAVPSTPEWIYVENDTREQPLELQTALETKKTGDRRNCKWCGKYKPDRCHHCRVCKTCVLKMDHHCPWIYNCVGLKNHKHFFLLLFYVTITALYVAITMAWTVYEVVVSQSDPSLVDLFVVLFGESLGGFLALICAGFFGFHLYLTIKAMTTIEFCEKQSGRVSGEGAASSASIFSKGVYGNFQEVLGKNPLIWFLPIHPDRGDGLSFDVDLTQFGERGINVSVTNAPLNGGRKQGYISTPATVDDDGGTGGRGGDEQTALLHRR